MKELGSKGNIIKRISINSNHSNIVKITRFYERKNR